MLVLPVNWDGSMGKQLSMSCVCYVFGSQRETEVI